MRSTLLVVAGSGWRSAALELVDLVLPVDCVGCGSPGRTLCGTCAALLQVRPRSRSVAGVGTVVSGVEYDGVARAAVLAFKNSGRTDLAGPLSGALGVAARHALEPLAAPVALVPMPPTRRSAVERGYDPVAVLLHRARLPAVRLLSLQRRASDQASLARAARLLNAAGSMRAAPAAAGLRVVLVDDVVTTGATLLDAARAVRQAGGTVLGAITLASTPEHRPIGTEQ